MRTKASTSLPMRISSGEGVGVDELVGGLGTFLFDIVLCLTNCHYGSKSDRIVVSGGCVAAMSPYKLTAK